VISARVLAAILTVVTAGRACGQEVRGVGLIPCSTWSGERAHGGHAYDAEGWVLGYLSALDVPPSPGRTNDDVFAAIDRLCATHPNLMLAAAVTTLFTKPRAEAPERPIG
jgi:hypothetical protein